VAVDCRFVFGVDVKERLGGWENGQVLFQVEKNSGFEACIYPGRLAVITGG